MGEHGAVFKGVKQRYLVAPSNVAPLREIKDALRGINHNYLFKFEGAYKPGAA